jgi:hypothetical protein
VVPGRPPRQSRLRALLHQAKPSLAGRTILIRRGGQQPWDLVWQTASDNVRAQAVYERIGATREDRWLDYELPVDPA